MNDMVETKPGHRRLILIGLAIALAATGAVAAVQRSGDEGPVDRAISVLEKDSRFDSSEEAVESFAVVYHHLVDATRMYPKDCDVAAGKGQCIALNQAAGWSLNFSPGSGHCTQPAIQSGRTAIHDYLKESLALPDAATEPPPLPAIPTC